MACITEPSAPQRYEQLKHVYGRMADMFLPTLQYMA
jgi:hypothetical protein